MKRYILSIVALLSVFSLTAQEKPNDNAAPKAMVKVTYPPMMEQNKFLSLSVGGGISTLMYDFPYGSSEWGKGGRFNIDYNIFFSQVCGISFGVGGSKYNSTVIFDNNSTYQTAINIPSYSYNNESFDTEAQCTTTFFDWKESQSVFALEIPVGVIFRAPLGKKATFLAGVGAKLSFPLKSSYEVTDGKLSSSLYNKKFNVQLDSIPDHGVTESNMHPSGSSESKIISASGYLDLNFVHRVGKIHLYYGLYGDYGLSSIAKKEKALTSIVEYNGVLSSDAVEKVIPFSVGVRLGVKIPCPRLKDQDRDGVIDKFDNCPNTPVGLPVDTCGCPLDTDGDGVYDYLDRCGDTPKGVLVDTCGCPLDTDGDGVPDHQDQCPYTPKNTPVDNHGCPFDADGDGVPDHVDKCPRTPEGVKVDQNGCPFDTDGDGIPDYLDKCPTIPGVEANQGCPDVSEKARKAFKNAEHGIEFEPGTAVLIRSSCHYIDKIISIMREYPNYRLVVNGHTDSSGSMAVNLKISKRRAMAIVDYMVERGIYPSRLKSFGHGGTQPIGDNKTLNGRKLNNRIEFKVEFDQ
ncbi:MAG: OmpA family protein [Bacteroidales bacterium]|jgi:outer membrane protein OmpA-like peptidoglycan-associated protein|nr:OmpA family protein [Bacteroidales bacterium]MBP5705111.1 OmpA family protein [Paludibacteraceae bacterium]